MKRVEILPIMKELSKIWSIISLSRGCEGNPQWAVYSLQSTVGGRQLVKVGSRQ